MKKEDLLDAETVKRNVPKWVVATCATLMFLSVFINSIGLNLMQVNGALTNKIVASLEAPQKAREDVKTIKINEHQPLDLEAIKERLRALEAISHKPANKAEK
jgi:hypothetical protein